MQKTNQKEFRIEKVIKRKGNKLYVKWIGYDNSFKRHWMKFPCMKMSQYFPKPFRNFGGDINDKADLSKHAKKGDIKIVTHVDTSGFALITQYKSLRLKTEVDKWDIDKLVPVPVDLSKLNDVVKNDVVKKAVCDKLVPKVNNIDTSGFILKTKYDTDKAELEKKISDVTDLVKKTKLIELENKIPDVSGLARKSALTVVENKIPDVGSSVKITDYNRRITKIETKITIIMMTNILLLRNLIS